MLIFNDDDDARPLQIIPEVLLELGALEEIDEGRDRMNGFRVSSSALPSENNNEEGRSMLFS